MCKVRGRGGDNAGATVCVRYEVGMETCSSNCVCKVRGRAVDCVSRV